MSKRHHSSRRRSYGRRQHELRERTERQSMAAVVTPGGEQQEADRDALGFFDLEFVMRRLSLAVGD